MAVPYDQQDISQRINIRDLIDTLQSTFVNQFATVDARQLSDYITQHSLHGTCDIGDVQCSLAEGLIACKLACPTLHSCQYFFRQQGQGSHRGIDIIMPQGTPIASFSDGEVSRVKHRDGNPNNEGNTIVIRTAGNRYLCYEHLDSIDVTAMS